MQSFIVLGIIPGTNIQTTLNFWVAVAIVLAIFAIRNQLNVARKLLRKHLSVRRLSYAFERYEFVVVQ